jgi:hypothetical protein
MVSLSVGAAEHCSASAAKRSSYRKGKNKKPFALEKRSYRRGKNRKTIRACEALLQEKQEKPFALEKRSYRAFL